MTLPRPGRAAAVRFPRFPAANLNHASFSPGFPTRIPALSAKPPGNRLFLRMVPGRCIRSATLDGRVSRSDRPPRTYLSKNQAQMMPEFPSLPPASGSNPPECPPDRPAAIPRRRPEAGFAAGSADAEYVCLHIRGVPSQKSGGNRPSPPLPRLMPLLPPSPADAAGQVPAGPVLYTMGAGAVTP